MLTCIFPVHYRGRIRGITLLKLAIIGAGAIAHHHEQAIAALPQACLVAVADPQIERARDIAGKHGATAYSDYHELFGAHDIDAAAILTPHAQHAQHAVDAMEAGSHVVIEKPTAVSMEQLRDIADVSRATEKMVRICHGMRYSPLIQCVRRMIDEEKLGTLLATQRSDSRIYFWPDRAAWSLKHELAGGGILINTGMHRLDAIFQATGSPFVAVKGRIGAPGPNADVEGDYSLYLEHENNVVTTVHCNGNVLPAGGYVCYMGDKANLIYQDDILLLESDGKRNKIEVPPAEASTYVMTWRDILDDLQTGSQKAATLEYGAHFVAVALAAYKSQETGRLEPIPVL